MSYSWAGSRWRGKNDDERKRFHFTGKDKASGVRKTVKDATRRRNRQASKQLARQAKHGIR